MNLIDITNAFATEEQCLEFLEKDALTGRPLELGVGLSLEQWTIQEAVGF